MLREVFPTERHLVSLQRFVFFAVASNIFACLCTMKDLEGRERLEKFLGDCALLGPVRFVCITDGAILEAVGSFDNLRYSDLPKGR